MVENIEFIEESSKIPFPQSDDLNRFIFIGRCLLKKDKSKEDIKESNQIGNRIVNFYISTGFYFHLFEKYKKDKTEVKKYNTSRKKQAEKKNVVKPEKSLCPVHGKCGGCQLLDMPYEKQLKKKQKSKKHNNS